MASQPVQDGPAVVSVLCDVRAEVRSESLHLPRSREQKASNEEHEGEGDVRPGSIPQRRLRTLISGSPEAPMF